MLEDAVKEIKVNSGDIIYERISVSQSDASQEVKVGDIVEDKKTQQVTDVICSRNVLGTVSICGG